MKVSTSFFILPLFFLSCLTSCIDNNGPSVQTLYLDYLAQKDIKSGKYEEALTQYYLLLENNNQRAPVHSNIGVLQSMLQKPDEALKSLEHALKLAESVNDKEAIYVIRYNLGVYFGALKKIPEALDNYQVALDLIPSSHEIKTNIELLMQKQQDQKQKNDQQNEQQQKKDDQSDKGKNDKGRDNNEKDNEGNKGEESKKASSPKYQPRPYKGDQLSEGDVKKILGELKNQEQKIRANFDKKEKKGKRTENEKDW